MNTSRPIKDTGAVYTVSCPHCGELVAAPPRPGSVTPRAGLRRTGRCRHNRDEVDADGVDEADHDVGHETQHGPESQEPADQHDDAGQRRTGRASAAGRSRGGPPARRRR